MSSQSHAASDRPDGIAYLVVSVGSSPLNDSIPDARVGLEVLREAQAMLRDGASGKDVLAKLSVKWGVTEVIQAIAMALGQENLRQAVIKGRLYATNADPLEAS